MSAVLTLLRIKNLALVDDLEWEIEPGFTAITGETGAGKSIIIGALQLLLGERADKSLIRTGADTCTVEALFTGDSLLTLGPQLAEAGVETNDCEIIVKRSLTVTGANRQFVNGSPTTLAVLKRIGDELIDLHGPHDHQSLLSPQRQLGLIDSYSGASEARERFAVKFSEWQALLAAHAALDTAEVTREQELELLRHQTVEISAANLSVSEEGEIESRYKLASNSRRLIELAGGIARKLADDDASILSQLADTQRALRELEKIDPEVAELSSTHAAAVVELSEISTALSTYAEKLDLDPAQLSALEQRVSLFESLKRKYGGRIEDVIAFGERAAERMRKIEGRDAELERLSRSIQMARQELEKLGQALRKLRAKGAPKLAETVRTNLRELGFRQSKFEAELTAVAEPRADGLDSAELMFSPNPGEPLKPLRSIASSGEISRLMLAVKSALAAQDAIPLLVFDEIDANVGGEIAHAVGAQMRELGHDHQVLCITHLPQVAAAAASHFVVTKNVTGGRTFSRLEKVNGKARREEIARMLGGKTDEALKLAASLLHEK